MIEFIFASSNTHKLTEIKSILPDWIRVRSMSEIACAVELPETGHTLEDNAQEKLMAFYKIVGKDCFSEDSGLEVDALGGAPGVNTAIYSGSRNAMDNMELLLSEMKHIANRRARFRTVIALHLRGQIHLFEGRVEGMIAESMAGNSGFGYDPIFIPNGYKHTFAQLPEEIKSSISHRAEAVQKMCRFLESYK
ncbi:MAG: RdgB/HAM1 family non-canonical purine NTP pyrophosphatase [Saprospiraceae bacterium]|nr:RdgB/HAM1 family non-canonical purine NTP pyrophosphatase [Saprospiraceae bacterium]